MTKARLVSQGQRTQSEALTYPADATELVVEPGEGGTVEAADVCKACAKAAEARDDAGYSVVTAPTGKPHYTEIGSSTTLCGRETADW